MRWGEDGAVPDPVTRRAVVVALVLLMFAAGIALVCVEGTC